ncbi:hypothetical protein TNCV_1989751 [Trichonephila clavipes]|nr:hypothetical protein TNCV_1989751 [Trichonephila clavipes]
MDVCKCIVPLRHGGTLNSRRAASPRGRGREVILTPSFLPRGRHLSSDDANLYYDLILPRASKPNRHSRDLLHAVYDMAAVDFLHHENPPTWAGVEPATLGAEGQRHAT